MIKNLFITLLSIPLLTTFYLSDGSYIWKASNEWSYWTYIQVHESGWRGRNFDVKVPLGVKFWHENVECKIPFSSIVKITSE